jgi:peptide/nickel transport system permease protein
MSNTENEKFVEKNENEIALKETAGLSQGQIIIRRFVRHKAAMGSLIGLIFIILFSFSASGIHLGNSDNPITVKGWWPYSIEDIDPEGSLASMCENGIPGCPTMDFVPEFIDGDGMGFGAHPLGMDQLGTDYFALVARGAEQSIMVMFIVGFLGLFIGTIVGAIAGFYGGIVDAILMRVTDIFLVTPTIIIGAVIVMAVGLDKWRQGRSH